jgi:hypothetical protein
MPMQVTVSASSTVSRLIIGVLLLAVFQSTGRGLEVPPDPGDPIPTKTQRLFALNVHTGEVAYDQTVQGPLTNASLSDGARAAYAALEPGSTVLYPRTNVFVQDFAASASTLLSQVGDTLNALTATGSRVAWAVDGYFKVHSTANGTTTFHSAEVFGDLRIAHDVATYINHDSYPGQVVAHDLVTGESASNFHADLLLLRIVSPRDFDAAHDSLIGVMIDFLTNQTKVAKLSPNAPPEHLPIAASNLATNGEQIVFNGLNLTGDASANLFLYDSGLFTLLATRQELGADGAWSSEFSISENSIAWATGLPEDRRIWIRNIASGVATQLQSKAPGLRLWDLNDDYILLSSDVLPVPEPSSCLLLAFALASGVRQRRSLRQRRCIS